MKKKTLYTCVLSTALLVSGCGGGGGGAASGAAPVAPVAPAPVSDINVLEEASNDVTTAANDDFMRAGDSEPSRGSSVYQSTNLDESNKTQDAVNLQVSGADLDNLTFALQYDVNADGTVEETINSENITEYSIKAAGTAGWSDRDYRWLDIYRGLPFDPDGDGTEDGKVYARLYTNYDTPNDTDYVSGGIWLYLPDDTTENYAMGAFADPQILSPSADISARVGSARYEGEGTAVYSEINVATGITDIHSIYFRTEFRVDFDANTVGGTIDEASRTEDSSIRYAGSITLDNATIDTSVNGGFFTSAASGTIGGVDLTGNWGGEFFQEGSDATAGIAGTIGGAGSCVITECQGYDYTFMGAFITYEE